MVRRSGLGRGLGALIPPEAGVDRGSALREIPLSNIRPNPRQPRARFEEEALSSMAASVRELGILQPVLVRAAGEDEYELIAGERRWRAARRAGLQSVPAIVQVATDESSLKQALVENLHREDLNPLEEAAAYQQLIEDFGLTHDELARRVGKSRVAVTNTIRLFQLPPAVQKSVSEGELGAGHARALLGTPDRGFQEALARKAAMEGLSVRAVEHAVRARNDSPELPADGARSAAQRRTQRSPGLLELEEMLSDQLETRVKVDMGSRKGRITIEFASLEDLERIYRAMVGTRSSA